MRRAAARLLASLLVVWAAPGLAPYTAAAQVVAAPAAASAAVSRIPAGTFSAVSAPVAGAPTARPTTVFPLLASPTAAPAPALSVLAAAPSAAAAAAVAPLSAAAAPAVAPAPAPVVGRAAPSAAPRASLKSAAAEVERAAGTLSRLPSEAASAEVETQFRLLVGEADAPRPSSPQPVAAAAGKNAPRLSPSAPLDPERRRGERTMIAATSAMKLGMETVTLSVPMLVLQGMGGAALVATLMVGYGVAQALFSGAAGGLIERSSPQKVLALSVAAQAVLVGGIVGLGAAGLLGVPALAAGYILVGGAAGIMETARQSIPARLLGRDPDELSRYNARLHIFYEVAGVVGPLAAGVLMTAFGPLWALLIQPPAYLAAAWMFSRVRLPQVAAPAPASAPDVRSGSVLDRVKEYVADVKAGARVVLGDRRLRWFALAFVLPQMLHRLLEGLLLPVFASRVLLHAGHSAYLLTASNMGELVGAALLLKLAERVPVPAWVRRAGAALAIAAVLAFTHTLWLALPAVLLMSATWSSSDLALRSDLQSRLDEKALPRATAFLYGALVLGAAAASLGLGFLFDALAPGAAFAWTAGAYAAVGAVVWLAARRLGAPIDDGAREKR